MAMHKTVLVRWGEDEAQIDVEIAPLIREIWKAGVFTRNSCQEDRPGWVWIEFGNAFEAERFLNIVAVYDRESGSLYNRIRQAWGTCDGESDDAWEYDAHPWDLAVKRELIDDDYIEEFCEGPSEFFFRFSIRFPRTDLPKVLERVRQHNANRQDDAVDMKDELTSEEHDGNGEPTWEPLGIVTIDTGRLLLIDPANADAVYNVDSDFSEGIVPLDDGCMGGVVTPTGMGDGCYCVEGCYAGAPGGQWLAEIRIRFIDEEGNWLGGHDCHISESV